MVAQLEIWHLRPRFAPVCLDRTRSHRPVSSQRTSLDNSGCVYLCAAAVRQLVSRCNLHAARLPDLWVVEGGGGGLGAWEGGSKLLTIMLAALAASSSKSGRHLAEGGQRSSGFVKLTVKSVPGCFLATSWLFDKCWKTRSGNTDVNRLWFFFSFHWGKHCHIC